MTSYSLHATLSLPAEQHFWRVLISSDFLKPQNNLHPFFNPQWYIAHTPQQKFPVWLAWFPVSVPLQICCATQDENTLPAECFSTKPLPVHSLDEGQWWSLGWQQKTHPTRQGNIKRIFTLCNPCIWLWNLHSLTPFSVRRGRDLCRVGLIVGSPADSTNTCWR